MKVFVVPSWHPSPVNPLSANWVLPHIELLLDAGVEVYVLHLGVDNVEIPKDSDYWGQPIRLLDGRRLYVPVPNLTKGYLRNRFFYRFYLQKYTEKLRELYKIAEENWGKPDIIHAHVSLPAGYAAAKIGSEFGIPVIVQEHYSGFESDSRFPWRVGSYVRKMGSKIHGFYAVSPGFSKRIQSTGLIKVSGVLPNPINTKLFDFTHRNNNGEVFKIITAGDVSHIKGTDILFSALSKLPLHMKWELTILGNISNEKKFSKWLNDPQFSKHLCLPGRVSQNEMLRKFIESDLYIVSSRSETANVSMLQAMATGLFVVTTICGGPETLIDDSVGIVLKSEDSNSLSRVIIDIYNNRNSYNPQKIRQFIVERYSLEILAKNLLIIYSDIVKNYYINLKKF